MTAPHIWIVSPALAAANNGNWHTASRWARFLRTRYRVTLAQQWPAPDGSARPPDLLIALHARRSAASLAAFRAACPARPTLLLLTGTDLYRDIRGDPAARQSLRLAGALALLQPAGLAELAPALRAKASVIYQSAPQLRPAAGRRRHFDVCMVGHLRAEKDPATFMRAAALVRRAGVRLLHIGAALDPALGRLAAATAAATPRYRWLGPMQHAATRQRLKRCQLMALSSHMEGGANVIIEAVRSGVAVLASDVSGNRGMLGDDYAGYFPAGDAAALAGLIERCAAEPAFHARLQAQCAARAPLFAPAAERAALLQLVDNLLLRGAGQAPSGIPRPHAQNMEDL
ncbi:MULTISPECIES: selenoneine biosynthesis selenosugar synthase SenB [unclassified Janthinobacterium]|uniref:selenoneine biosynthesis selenosugar synthase SenB n=1 Tax=unclassified Janthinobacterium TaxID=2610881 RepID=UPI00034AD574|nr:MULTISPECIES: selenoneine biosynthesis selenosugar synthase SenB [unclassified Janthinobacterium]MEC5160458.1 putative glycosyltransferase (TIGR04348 family) [Janthinobacterium sp. CG_S6]